MKKLAIAAGLAMGLSLTACGGTKTVTRDVPGPVVIKTVPGPVTTKTVKVKVTAAAPAAAAAVPAPAPIASAAPVTFACTVMSGMGGATNLEARVWGEGEREAYSGPIYISFSDGPGDGFPGLSGQMSDGLAWVPIPAADVGASAEPSYCSVSS